MERSIEISLPWHEQEKIHTIMGYCNSEEDDDDLMGSVAVFERSITFADGIA